MFLFSLVCLSLSLSHSHSLSDGPDNMALTVNGHNTTSFLVGSNLTMLCSAHSSPPALLQWDFRGESVNTTGPFLELYNVTQDQSGAYSCLAFNNRTGMSSNVTSYITIASEFISIVMSTSICSYLFRVFSFYVNCLRRVSSLRIWTPGC